MKAHEVVDLVDECGHVRMRGVTRGEVARRKDEFVSAGLYQPIVVVVVVNQDHQIVAQVRGPGKGEDGAGELDHVCGVVAAGESWQTAAVREAAEEIGVAVHDLRVVLSGINAYDRYRTLVVARTWNEPQVIDESEVSAVVVESPRRLRALERAGTAFVRGFFEDIEEATRTLGDTGPASSTERAIGQRARGDRTDGYESRGSH